MNHVTILIILIYKLLYKQLIVLQLKNSSKRSRCKQTPRSCYTIGFYKHLKFIMTQCKKKNVFEFSWSKLYFFIYKNKIYNRYNVALLVKNVMLLLWLVLHLTRIHEWGNRSITAPHLFYFFFLTIIILVRLLA